MANNQTNKEKPLTLEDFVKNHGDLVEQLKGQHREEFEEEMKQPETDKAGPRFETFAPGKYKR